MEGIILETIQSRTIIGKL